MMNILFLENQNSWRTGCLIKLSNGGINKIEVLTELQLSEPSKDLAKYIHEEFPYIDLFLININLNSGTENRSACAGIKLFKFLRLYHLNQHCVLYSFLSREQLMQRSPDNLILFSEGISFIRLPLNLGSIDFDNLAKKISPVDLSLYLKAESRLPDDRHFFANWWGVLQLWKVYRALHLPDEKEINSIEKEMFVSSQNKDDYQGLLAQYLSGNETQKITPTIIGQLKELYNITYESKSIDKGLEQLEKKRRVYEDEFRRLSEKLEIIIDKDKWQKYMIDYYSQIDFFDNNAQQIYDQQVDLKPRSDFKVKMNELISRIEEEKRQLEEEGEILISRISEKIEKKANIKLSENISDDQTFTQKLKEDSPKICYIDDQADEGWAVIFQYMIYGEIDSTNFKVFNPSCSTKKSLISDCFNYMADFDPDLIILDLRLFGEKGTITDYDKLSGISVLKALKHGYPGYQPVICPILIVTASNKSFALNASIESGANGYWLKEGLDNRYTPEETINNYWDFLDKVYQLCCNPEYQLIRKMKSGFQTLQKQEIFWWESDNRFVQLLNPSNKLKKISRKSVLRNILEGIDFLESFLQNKLMKNLSPGLEAYIPSLVVIKLFKIIELFHAENEGNNQSSSMVKKILKHHGNEVVYRLLEIVNLRNKSVHDMTLTLPELELFFEYLIGYVAKKTFNAKEYLAWQNILFSDNNMHHSIVKAITKNNIYIDKNYTLLELSNDIKYSKINNLKNNTVKLEDLVSFHYLKPEAENKTMKISIKPNPFYVLRQHR